MHVAETCFNYIFFPCIDLCYLSEAKSSIYNENSKPYYLKEYGPLMKDINSPYFEYWNKNLTTSLCICTYNNYDLLYKCLLSAGAIIEFFLFQQKSGFSALILIKAFDGFFMNPKGSQSFNSEESSTIEINFAAPFLLKI